MTLRQTKKAQPDQINALIERKRLDYLAASDRFQVALDKMNAALHACGEAYAELGAATTECHAKITAWQTVQGEFAEAVRTEIAADPAHNGFAA